MILQILAGAAALGGLYEWSKGPDTPAAVQVQKGTTATGVPISVVAPVIPKVTPVQANPSTYQPPPPMTNYTKPLIPLSVSTAPGSFSLAPIIISPSGAASVSVATNQDVQNALNTLNFALPLLVADGNIGPLSQKAIKAFESSIGMTPDGQPTPALKAALSTALQTLGSPNAAIGQSPAVQSATHQSASATVPIFSSADVQKTLNLLGALPPLSVSAQIDRATVAAIKAFQMLHGLVVDGIAGPKTLTALQLALQESSNPTASDAAATGFIPGAGILSTEQLNTIHGESYDSYQREKNMRDPYKTHHNYTYPPRTDQGPRPYGYPNDVNEDELGIYFDANQQRLVRDGGTPLGFGHDDFGIQAPSTVHNFANPNIAPPSIPSTSTTYAFPPHTFNPFIAPPTGRLAPGMIAPPPPPFVPSPFIPPPVLPQNVIAPPPPPGFPAPVPGTVWNQPFTPQDNRFPYRRHQAHERAERLRRQQQDFQNQQDYQQSDPTAVNASVASSYDPSMASAPLPVAMAAIQVPSGQTVDPNLVQAVLDNDAQDADEQAGAIDSTTGASDDILSVGFEGGDFGASSGHKKRHHKRHQQNQQSQQDQGGSGGGGGGGQSSDDDSDDFGVVAPPPPPTMVQQHYYPPPPPGFPASVPGVPIGNQFPYQGPQGPNRKHHHHHRHNQNQQNQQYQQNQAAQQYQQQPPYYPSDDNGDGGDDSGYGHEADNLAKTSRTKA